MNSKNKFFGLLIIYATTVNAADLGNVLKPIDAFTKPLDKIKNITAPAQQFLTKNLPNIPTIWGDDSLNFNDIFPKPIYRKSYFSFMIMGTSVAIGSAFTVLTYGGGAPAAMAGMSSVASWIAGGGAGSYMAGLSTVGGLVGGNAITGAMILNGLAVGIASQQVVQKAVMLIPEEQKFGIISNFAATMIDGVSVIKNPETGKVYYTIKLTFPSGLGNDKTKNLVTEFYENEEKKNQALEKGEEKTVKKYQDINNILMKDGQTLLSELLKDPKDQSTHDLLILGMVSYAGGAVDLFKQSVDKILSYKKIDNSGFLDYLHALSLLSDGNEITALKFLDKSLSKNPYAIEPALLYINILGNNLTSHEERIDKIKEIINLAEKNFDTDKYASPYTLLALYFRAATIFYSNNFFNEARIFYEKALNEIGWIDGLLALTNFKSNDIKNQIQLGRANCYHLVGNDAKGKEIFNELTKGLDAENIKKIEMLYVGDQS